MTLVKNKKTKIIFTCALLLLFSLILSSCSLNKDDASLSLVDSELQYHEETNITTVYCKLVIENDTAYSINSFEVDFNVSYKGQAIDTDSYSFDQRIKHGEDEVITVSFNVGGEVDQVGLVKWTPNFDPFWKVIFSFFDYFFD